MGDGHDGALVVPQEPLQPGHRLGVEVVGGLVEQQEVGPGQQEAAERDPAPFAARQRGDVGVARRHPQGVHGHVDGPLQVPRAGGLDALLEIGLALAELLVVGVRVGPAGQHRVVVGQQPRRLTGAVHDVADHVLRRVELRLLLEQPDGEPGREPGLAGVAVVDAGHDPQQRRLAGAVRAEHADLGAGVEGEGDVLQDLTVGWVEAAALPHGEDELCAGGGHGQRWCHARLPRSSPIPGAGPRARARSGRVLRTTGGCRRR